VRVFIELSGEHPTLPRAEALAALASERVEVRTASFDNQVLRVDALGPVERAVRRLGLAHLVSEELASGDFESVRAVAQESDLHGRTFRVRSRGLGLDLDPVAVEGPLGADFGRTGTVDLDQPAIDYRLLVGEEFLLGRVIHRIDRARLESTKVAHRSFSLPISLHPKFARALVNLARVPMAGTVLDPFCGTGGILLEASAIGLRPIGLDRDRRMVLGCRSSLRDAKAEDRLGVADAGRLPLRSGKVHGIATDPPYGRAASTRGEPIARLYERTFRAFRELLPTGTHAAIVLPNDAMIEMASKHLETVETHALRVHRSLVRHFCVFANS
jgi:tRNA (guanine10-N2)-dimethyltransferase